MESTWRIILALLLISKMSGVQQWAWRLIWDASYCTSYYSSWLFWPAAHMDLPLFRNSMLIRRPRRTGRFFHHMLLKCALSVFVSQTPRCSMIAALYPISNSMGASLMHFAAPQKCNFSKAHKDPCATTQCFSADSGPICPPLAPLKWL